MRRLAKVTCCVLMFSVIGGISTPKRETIWYTEVRMDVYDTPSYEEELGVCSDLWGGELIEYPTYWQCEIPGGSK